MPPAEAGDGEKRVANRAPAREDRQTWGRMPRRSPRVGPANPGLSAGTARAHRGETGAAHRAPERGGFMHSQKSGGVTCNTALVGTTGFTVTTSHANMSYTTGCTWTSTPAAGSPNLVCS